MAHVKPKIKLTGVNGNIFNLMGIASGALKNANLKDEAAKMIHEVTSCGSYEEALTIIMKYVEVE